MSFVLHDQLKPIATGAVEGEPTAASVREIIALTVAAVTIAERLYRLIGKPYPGQWESMERSASTFTDQFVVKWLAANDPELKRAVTKQRRRKLAARAGSLRLVESQRDKRARWVTITLPQDAPIPIPMDVADGLNERAMTFEDRIDQHLGNAAPSEPLALAGQVVGLLSASEILLALLPSNKVAAFCVQLASLTAARDA